MIVVGLFGVSLFFFSSFYLVILPAISSLPPSALHLLTHPLVYSLYPTIATQSGLSTIEQRYHLTSTLTGFIAATYDLSFLIFSVFVGYYGGKSHTPRWLAGGLAVLCIGAIVFILPRVAETFSDDLYQPPFSDDDSAPFCGTRTSLFTPVCDDPTNALVYFFVGMGIMGIGGTTLYTLGPPYIDNIAKRKVLPIYLAWFYGAAALGPALGFALGGLSLDYYISEPDEGTPPGLSKNSDAWLGAWWLGFVIAVVIAVAIFIPALAMYPRWVPNTRRVREVNHRRHMFIQQKINERDHHAVPKTALVPRDVEKDEIISRSFCASLGATLVNRTFLWQCMGQAMDAFAVSGFATFLAKTAESNFRLDASEASWLIGCVLVISAVVGVSLGGLLMKKVKATALETAGYTFRFAVLSAIFLPALLIGCGSVGLRGANVPHTLDVATPFTNISHPEFMAVCNQDCNCNYEQYNPFCGSDGKTYFSACHAGCTVPVDANDLSAFSNCACVTGTAKTAVEGICDKGCDKEVYWFTGIIFFASLFTFVNFVPSTTVVLLSLRYNERPVGMGVQNVIFRGLGTIPGPIIFGLVIDSVCLLQDEDCGEETGTCAEYDNEDMRLYLFVLAAVSKVLACLAYYLSYTDFKSPREEALTLFRSLDWDDSGGVSKEEVVQFIQLQRFLSNPLFKQDDNIANITAQVMRLDTNRDGQISQGELAKYINHLSKPEQEDLAKVVTKVTADTREKAIRKVFEALDWNKNGEIDCDELRFWLENEKWWQKTQKKMRHQHVYSSKSPQELRETIIAQIDLFPDRIIHYHELKNFFKTWTVRDLQLFSEDQRYYRELAQAAKRGLSFEVQQHQKNRLEVAQSSSNTNVELTEMKTE